MVRHKINRRALTVPVQWGKQQSTIVSNESSDIIRMFNAAFDGIGAAAGDYCPVAERGEIDALNARIYVTLNSGVCKAGFATTQSADEDAIDPLFTTLLRFDPVYVGHFKCNLRRIADDPNLSGYVRDLYQPPVSLRQSVSGASRTTITAATRP